MGASLSLLGSRPASEFWQEGGVWQEQGNPVPSLAVLCSKDVCRLAGVGGTAPSLVKAALCSQNQPREGGQGAAVTQCLNSEARGKLMDWPGLARGAAVQILWAAPGPENRREALHSISLADQTIKGGFTWSWIQHQLSLCSAPAARVFLPPEGSLVNQLG